MASWNFESMGAPILYNLSIMLVKHPLKTDIIPIRSVPMILMIVSGD